MNSFVKVEHVFMHLIEIWHHFLFPFQFVSVPIVNKKIVQDYPALLESLCDFKKAIRVFIFVN